MRKAIDAMLQAEPDAEPPTDKFALDMMLAAMAGAMRSVLEAGASSMMVRKLREHLVLLGVRRDLALGLPKLASDLLLPSASCAGGKEEAAKRKTKRPARPFADRYKN